MIHLTALVLGYIALVYGAAGLLLGLSSVFYHRNEVVAEFEKEHTKEDTEDMLVALAILFFVSPVLIWFKDGRDILYGDVNC
jgi:hypothetical protein